VKNNLLHQLEILGRWLACLVAIIAVVAFLLAMFHADNEFKAAFESAVAIAVAIIPEGLPAMVTIVLAIGTTGTVNLTKGGTWIGLAATGSARAGCILQRTQQMQSSRTTCSRNSSSIEVLPCLQLVCQQGCSLCSHTNVVHTSSGSPA
jgi:hypothetical protein